MIVSIDSEWNNEPSKSTSWKVLEIVVSHLKKEIEINVKEISRDKSRNCEVYRCFYTTASK